MRKQPVALKEHHAKHWERKLQENIDSFCAQAVALIILLKDMYMQLSKRLKPWTNWRRGACMDIRMYMHQSANLATNYLAHHKRARQKELSCFKLQGSPVGKHIGHENRGGFVQSGLGNFFSRLDDSVRNRIPSCLTAGLCFNHGYMGNRPLA